MICDRGRMSDKGPTAASIKFGHPLATNLVAAFFINEGGGFVQEAVSGFQVPLVLNSSQPIHKRFNFGAGIDHTTNNDTGAFTTCPTMLRIQPPLTILWRGNFDPSVSTLDWFFGVSASTNPATSPFYCYLLGRSTGQFIEFHWNKGVASTDNIDVSTGENKPAFDTQIVGVIKSGASKLYYGGLQVGSPQMRVIGTNSNSITSIDYSVSPQITIGLYPNIGRNSGVNTRHGYIWNRELSQAELQWLYVEPYAFISGYPLGKRNSILKPGFVPLSITKSDSINNLSDAVSLSNSAAAHYGIVASDRLDIRDSLALFGPPPDYKLTFGESLANIQDSARITLALTEQLSDSINNFADAFSKMVGIPIQVFDSQQFNWNDALVTNFGAPLSLTTADTINNLVDAVTIIRGNFIITLTFADTINLLADALRINAVLKIAVGDNYVLSDSLKMRFNHLMKIAEVLPAWLDVALLANTAKPAFSDSINNFNDAVQIAMIANERIQVGDALALTDSVRIRLTAVFNRPGFIARIRRYLGDTQSS